ncbi:hypothetical protein ACFQ4K_00665 [Tistrella bauzanensis]
MTLLYQLAVSAVALPLLALAHGADLAIPLTTTVVLSMGFQIVIVASLSYLGWFVLISRYPASRLSAFSFLTPLFGVAAAALILGDTLTPPSRSPWCWSPAASGWSTGRADGCRQRRWRRPD